ncbi:hypothetical protein WUBG_09482 [Wuchereria bancrofti]|uniref:Uncharacterized protein n=1 Tax=Wuchereria bancrofti TaxID=6293 RepID=J9AYF8_WUCBA|nr:hypothetical protein WUBG_09482 [Wuchereria bancrofti]
MSLFCQLAYGFGAYAVSDDCGIYFFFLCWMKAAAAAAAVAVVAAIGEALTECNNNSSSSSMLYACHCAVQHCNCNVAMLLHHIHIQYLPPGETGEEEMMNTQPFYI